jgi:hypothetical protein
VGSLVGQGVAIVQVRAMVSMLTAGVRLTRMPCTAPLPLNVLSMAGTPMFRSTLQFTHGTSIGDAKQIISQFRGIPENRMTLMVPNATRPLTALTRLGEVLSFDGGAHLDLVIVVSSRTCAYCGAWNYTLPKCSRCRTVHYCGPACSHADWPSHRLECRRG